MTVQSAAIAAVERCLRREQVSRSELARRMDISKPVISHVLNESGKEMTNTAATFDRMLDALGYEAAMVVVSKRGVRP